MIAALFIDGGQDHDDRTAWIENALSRPDNVLPDGRSSPLTWPPDTLGVEGLPPLLIWTVLALLGYCLVTSVLTILASRSKFEIQRHNLLVRSKLMRIEYLRSLEEKTAGVEVEAEMEEEFDEVVDKE